MIVVVWVCVMFLVVKVFCMIIYEINICGRVVNLKLLMIYILYIGNLLSICMYMLFDVIFIKLN